MSKLNLIEVTNGKSRQYLIYDFVASKLRFQVRLVVAKIFLSFPLKRVGMPTL